MSAHRSSLFGFLFLQMIFSGITAFGQVYSIQPVEDRYRLLLDSVPVNDTLYTEISEYVDGYFWVNKGELYGFIDSNGMEITAFIYDEVSSFCDGRARVARDSLYGFIDRKGEEVIEVQYREVTLFKFGLASVLKDSTWHLVDTTGGILTNLEFDHPGVYLIPDFICVCQNNRWGVMDSKGRIVHPFEYDLIRPDGRAWKNGHLLYLNKL